MKTAAVFRSVARYISPPLILTFCVRLYELSAVTYFGVPVSMVGQDANLIYIFVALSLVVSALVLPFVSRALVLMMNEVSTKARAATNLILLFFTCAVVVYSIVGINAALWVRCGLTAAFFAPVFVGMSYPISYLRGAIARTPFGMRLLLSPLGRILNPRRGQRSAYKTPRITVDPLAYVQTSSVLQYTVLVTLAAGSFSLGVIDARYKATYAVVFDHGRTLLALQQYGNDVILAPYDAKTHTLTETFTKRAVSGDHGVTLHLLNVGPVRKVVQEHCCDSPPNKKLAIKSENQQTSNLAGSSRRK